MSRIHLLSSEKFSDDLVVGWDPGSKSFFAMVDDSVEEPSRWAQRLADPAEIIKTFSEWGENLPTSVEEKLVLQRLHDSEEIVCFDLKTGQFIGQETDIFQS